MPVASDDVVWLDVLPSMDRFRSTLQAQAGTAATGAGAAAGSSFTSNFAKHLKVAAVLGTALAVGGAVKFMKEATREASNLGESLNAVKVTFGANAEGINRLGKAAAESVGLSNSEFNGLAVQFSAFATTIAGKGGDVVGTIEDLTVRGADFASVMNLDVNEAMSLFQSGLAGETEPLRRYGIDLSAAAVENYALANGIIKSGQEMTEAQKVQARYGSLMQQTSKVQGDFTNTSDSLANSQRILGARWDDIQAMVGSKVIPTLEKFSGWVLNEGLPAIMSFGGWIGDNVLPVAQRLFESFKAGAEAVLPKLGAAFGIVGNAIMATVGFFREHETAAKALGGVVAVVGGLVAAAWIAQGVVATINAAKAVASWFAVATASTTSATIQSRSTAQIVVGWVAAAAGATVNAVKIVAAWTVSVAQTGILMAMYASQSIAAAARSTAAWVAAQLRTVGALALTAAGFVAQGAVMAASMAGTAAKVVAGWVLMGLQSLLAAAKMAAAWLIAMGPVGWVIAAVIGLVAIIIANWDTIKRWTIDIWNAVVGFIKNAASAIWTWVTEKFTALKNGVIAIFTAVRDVVMAIWNGFKIAIVTAAKFIWDVVVAYFSLWKAAVILIFTTVRNVVVAIWNGFKNAIVAAAKFIWDVVVAYFNLWKAAVVFIFTTVRNTVVGVWNGLKDAVVNGAQFIWTWVVSKFNGLKTGVINIFNGIKNAVKSVWDKLIDVVKTPIRIAFEFVNSKMIGPVNSILGKFPGNLKIPSLPRLAEGGLLHGPGTGTSDSILGVDPRSGVPTAAVSNGEFVVREKQTRKHLPLLRAINQGVGGFADGGLIGRMFGVKGYGLGDLIDGAGNLIGGAWDAAKGAVGSVANFAKDMLVKGARKAAELVLGPIKEAVLGVIPNKVPLTLLAGGIERLYNAVLGKGSEKDKELAAAAPSGGSSTGLTANMARARQYTMDTYGVRNIGGFARRNIAGTNTLSDHALGKAIDIMTTNKALGWRIANDFAFGNANRMFGIENTIWQQSISSRGGPFRGMADRGSATQNHYDHVHADQFDDGGLWRPGRMGINLTAGVERVLTPPQDDYFRKFVDLTSRREDKAAASMPPVQLYTPDIPHAIRALRAEEQQREALAPAW